MRSNTPDTDDNCTNYFFSKNEFFLNRYDINELFIKTGNIGWRLLNLPLFLLFLLAVSFLDFWNSGKIDLRQPAALFMFKLWFRSILFHMGWRVIVLGLNMGRFFILDNFNLIFSYPKFLHICEMGRFAQLLYKFLSRDITGIKDIKNISSNQIT
ncbi:Uncharacterised protein [Mycobacteroides abscessus subsp. abscessus]|nr:Uncharacterised protein [Mycobacteroides abscessus subsp. abscessus]